MNEQVNKEQGTEPVQPAQVVPASPEQGLSIDRDSTAWLLSDDETNRYIEAANRLRTLEIKLTKPEDWVDFGGSVHLQDKRLGELTTYLQSLFGLNVTIMKPEISKETFQAMKTTTVNGKKTEVPIDVIEWIYRGGVRVEEVREVTGRVRRVRVIEPITGSCRTDDKLWSKKFGERLDPAFVQPSLVMKKAEANYRGNCLRYIWGLKGLDKSVLQEAGLDITRIKDSGIKDLKGDLTGANRDELGKVWIRILEAHGQSAEKAKAWLQQVTSFKGGTNHSTGKSYDGFDGYDNIYRVKPGSKSLAKITKGLEELEKTQAAGSAQEEKADAAEAKNGADAFMAYQKELDNAKTQTAITEIDTRVRADKKLNSAQKAALEKKANNRFDLLIVDDDKKEGGASA